MASKTPSPEMKLRERAVSESKDGYCVLCCEKSKYFAIGFCDHPVCFKCSARMRVLSKETYCASCRAEMDQVVFCRQVQSFQEFKLQHLIVKRKYGIRFEDRTIRDEFDQLLDYHCSECTTKQKETFYSMQELKSHLRKVHEKQFCDICIENLSIFPYEFKAYTKKELVGHRKEGDKDERSHRGHPECRFCDDRFFDNDSLLLHLRKNHFWCHFCEHDGKQDYYNVYEDLRKHFGVAHFLCDEGGCYNEKFTSVFREKIDYQAHKLAYHGQSLSKYQAKEARKVDIDYSDRQAKTNNITAGDYEEVQRGNDKKSRKQNKYQNKNGVSNTSNNDGSNTGMRGGRKTGPVNYYDYDDVEKDRKVFKPRQHEAEEVENRKSNLLALAASSAISYSEPDISHHHHYEFNNDDDVIGLSEHLNKQPDVIPGKKSKEGSKIKIDGKEEQTIASQVTTSPFKHVPKVEETKPKVLDDVTKDFPALPGAKPYQSTHVIGKVNEEAFPALQPTKKVQVENKKPKAKPSTGFGTHINGIPIKRVEKKTKGKSWSKQSGRAIAADTSDFPTLGGVPKPKNLPNENKDVKMPPPGYPTNNNHTKAPPPGYPTNSNHTKAPPPGYPTNKRSKDPPPGFSGKQNKNVTKTNLVKTVPPGLKKMSAGSPPPGFKRETTSSNDLKMERNLRLLGMLQSILDDFSMGIFKSLSGDFRKGDITAQQYYNDIQDLLGENLKEIFSELVALLPDEVKQQELLVVHNNQKIKIKTDKNPVVSKNPVLTNKIDYSNTIKWGAEVSPKITRKTEPINSYCSQCGETCPTEMLNEHMQQSHSSEAFPALPVQVKKKKNYGFTPIRVHRQVPVKNAWSAK